MCQSLQPTDAHICNDQRLGPIDTCTGSMSTQRVLWYCLLLTAWHTPMPSAAADSAAADTLRIQSLDR
jgi:hypothetical protein